MSILLLLIIMNENNRLYYVNITLQTNYIMSQGINCITDLATCDPNLFDEYRPPCNTIDNQDECNASQGCYYKYQCKYIDAEYCETASTIEACRKDSNDYCYFSNGVCMACNTGSLDDTSTNYKLISMDGRQCFDNANTCKPYYQQGNHAACRKYCEFAYAPDDGNGTCTLLTTTNSKTILDHTVITKTNCGSIYNGTGRRYGDPYQLYLNINESRLNGCFTKSVTDVVSVAIYSQSHKLVNSYTSGSPDCATNFVVIDYEPVLPGEAGPLLTGRGIGANQSYSKLISYVCTCPPGFQLSGDTCNECPVGSITTGYDSNNCVSTSTKAVDQSGVILMETCQQWQKYVQKNIRNQNYYICEDCPLGQYGNGTECVYAPKSWYVKVPSKNPTTRDAEPTGLQRCANGTTPQNGSYAQFFCEPILQGSLVDALGNTVTTCPPGQRQIPNTQLCEMCPAGQYLDNQNQCQNCPAGTYRGTLDAQTQPTTQDASSSSCTPCPTGTWSVEGSTGPMSCINCQQNKVLSNGVCKAQCDAGSYQDTNNICQKCPPGTISNGTVSCDVCPTDKVASSDQTSCVTTCYQGEGKTEVTYNDQTVLQCQACPLGTFSDGTTACQECPSGQVTNSINSSTCINCNANEAASVNHQTCGTGCNQGESKNPVAGLQDVFQCTQCTPGSFGTDGITCQPCPAGKITQNAGNTECTECQANYAASSNHQSCNSDCSSGEGKTLAPGYSNVFQCTQCPAGQYGDGTTVCNNCNPGTYSGAGQSQCTECSEGSIAAASGSSACQGCQTNEAASLDHRSCGENCTTGQGKKSVQFDGQQTSQCETCPDGTASLGDTECQVCTGDQAASITHTECVSTCGGGNSMINVTSNGTQAKQCQACPPGKFSTDGMTCSNCAAGTYSSQSGSTECSTCNDGYITTAEGSTQCTQCTGGQTATVDHQRCETACPTGEGKQKVTGLQDGFQCTQCQAGEFSVGSDPCQKCQLGTIAESAGSSTCTSCQDGSVANKTGSTACYICSNLHAASIEHNKCLTLCGAGNGKVDVTIDGQLARQCQQCAAGTFSLHGNQACEDCQPGTFAANPGSAACTPCIDGSFSSARSTQCSACPTGQTASLDHSGCSENCTSGQGKKDVIFNNQTSLQCELCQPGYFSDGSAVCTACEVGTFADTSGSPSCATCGDGLVALTTGSSSCTSCSNGYAASSDHTQCVDHCGSGSGKEEISGRFQCRQCDAGEFGTGSTPCQACNAGTYSDTPGSYSCQSCAFSKVSGAKSTQCSDCSSGKVAAADQSACLENCPAGFGPKFQNNTFATSIQTGDVIQCATCLDGFYSNAKTAFICIQCPPSYISADNKQSCILDCKNKVANLAGDTCLDMCPAGQERGSNQCRKCQENYVSQAGEQCKPCSANEVAINNVCVPKNQEPDTEKKNIPVVGIVVGIVAVLVVIGIIIGVVYGIKARRAKKNALFTRRIALDDTAKSDSRKRYVESSEINGLRHSQTLI